MAYSHQHTYCHDVALYSDHSAWYDWWNLYRAVLLSCIHEHIIFLPLWLTFIFLSSATDVVSSIFRHKHVYRYRAATSARTGQDSAVVSTSGNERLTVHQLYLPFSRIAMSTNERSLACGNGVVFSLAIMSQLVCIKPLVHYPTGPDTLSIYGCPKDTTGQPTNHLVV